MKMWISFCCLLALWSCNGSQTATSTGKPLVKQDSVVVPVLPNDSLTFSSSLRAGDILLKGKIYMDTLSFISYDDNGDEVLLICVKDRDTVPFIFNNASTIPALNNGDQVTVKWDVDMYVPAGDPDYPYPREFALDYYLLQPGKVTLLKQKHPKLEALFRYKELSETGKDAINAAAWYYVANTTDTTIRNIIDAGQETLQYIVEEQPQNENGVVPVTFTTAGQQVLKRLFFNAEKPYSLFE